MQEKWRKIDGLPYLVSSSGILKSLWGRYKEDILKPQTSKTNYLQVGLTDMSGKQYPYLVHVLVARAFPEICGEWFDGAVVHHKDGDRQNNNAENLIILTKDEHNRIHKENELTKQRRFDAQRNRPDCSKPIVQYTLDMQYVNEYPSAMEAYRQTGLNRGHINRCARGEIKSFKGYIWKFR